jgi:hypothetical protein
MSREEVDTASIAMLRDEIARFVCDAPRAVNLEEITGVVAEDGALPNTLRLIRQLADALAREGLISYDGLNGRYGPPVLSAA